jgi:hypothetical protein
MRSSGGCGADARGVLIRGRPGRCDALRDEKASTLEEVAIMSSSTKILALAVTTLVVGSGCATGDRTDGATTTTLPAAGGGQVVIGAPVRGVVQHTIVGKVTGIDRNDGEVTVQTPDGSKVKLKLPAFALASVREGDPVSLNVTVNPQQ